MKYKLLILSLLIGITACKKDDYVYEPPVIPDPQPTITDEELLDLTQKETLKYFTKFAHPNSGAARERYHPDNPDKSAQVVTSGGSGFGLMSLIVGIERGFISRDEGITQINKILSFFENADRFHGAWPHWLNGDTGRVIPFSTKDDGGDIVETAFLAQGLITVYEYLKDGTDTEKAIAKKADELWKGVEWNWYTNSKPELLWHWSPNYGFEINLRLSGYNETLITYILAASSPEYAIEKEVYEKGWANNGAIKSSATQYGYPLVLKHVGGSNLGGPLFWAHYSYLGLNPKNLNDQYADYWQLNVSHTMINNQYCIKNPKNFKDYGKDCWGLTASYTRKENGNIGYKAHKPANDSGVISPTAAISSIPYAPEESLNAMHYFYKHKDKLLGPAGFYDAFSPQYDFWVAKAYLAIDQGPQIIMIENYRTGLLWKLFMQNENVKAGLSKLGFTHS